MPSRIAVTTSSPYEVVVGRDLGAELPPLLTGARQVAVVHPRSLADRVPALAERLRDHGLAVLSLPVPDGEACKDLGVAAQLWDALGAAALTRNDMVVSLGGGATTDLAGFVAATWLRGVRVVHLPTTLLAMVDAAVGGKTAINTAAGKNLVGAFHEPAGVVCDLDQLAGLPRAELASGLAEVAKVGFTHDPRVLELLDDLGSDLGSDSHGLQELVERAVRVKAAVVAGDLTDRGGREVLNYGHTLGHAVEKAERFGWRHGEAVSVGMVYAAELSRLTAGLDDALVDRHREVLGRLGLPVTYDGDWPALHAAMRVDKKSRGDRLRFVVLEGLGAARVLEDVDDGALLTAWGRLRSGSMQA